MHTTHRGEHDVSAVRAAIFSDLTPLSVYAEAAGVAYRTAADWVKNGLPVRKIGDVTYVALTEASKFWEQRGVRPRGRHARKRAA